MREVTHVRCYYYYLLLLLFKHCCNRTDLDHTLLIHFFSGVSKFPAPFTFIMNSTNTDFELRFLTEFHGWMGNVFVQRMSGLTSLRSFVSLLSLSNKFLR